MQSLSFGILSGSTMGLATSWPFNVAYDGGPYNMPRAICIHARIPTLV
jgi:hypothetical protein